MQLTGPAFLLSVVESRWKPARQLILVVQQGQFRILKRLIAFQNNQAFSDIGRPRSFALARFGPLDCPLDLRAQAEDRSALRSDTLRRVFPQLTGATGTPEISL